MTAQIIKLKDRQVKYRNVHQSLIEAAIRSIKANLTDSSMEHLVPFIAAACRSPEFLCRVRNSDLWNIQDSVEAELNYRHDMEKKA